LGAPSLEEWLPDPIREQWRCPMDRDDFIISVYCLVCEHYQAIQTSYPLQRGGFAPALTDAEVSKPPCQAP
jgi:hypothetical protein